VKLNGDLALAADDFQFYPVIPDAADHAFQVGNRRDRLIVQLANQIAFPQAIGPGEW
jgi:hypothetical protein